jgi:hypothetical protein
MAGLWDEAAFDPQVTQPAARGPGGTGVLRTLHRYETYAVKEVEELGRKRKEKEDYHYFASDPPTSIYRPNARFGPWDSRRDEPSHGLEKSCVDRTSSKKKL